MAAGGTNPAQVPRPPAIPPLPAMILPAPAADLVNALRPQAPARAEARTRRRWTDWRHFARSLASMGASLRREAVLLRSWRIERQAPRHDEERTACWFRFATTMLIRPSRR